MDVQVRFQPSGLSVCAPAGHTLFDAVRLSGLPMASACGAEGLCGRCGVRVLAGAASLQQETAAETDAKLRNRIDPELRLACQTILNGDLEVTASYW